jgi:hypothetical protein
MMSKPEFEEPIAPFQAIGAGVSIGRHTDGTPFVFGIQCGRATSPVDDRHVAMLSSFPELVAVGLEGAQISDDALSHICQLRHLQSLDLTRATISDKCFRFIGQMDWLEFLHIENTLVSEAGVRDLQSKLPNCEICSDWT